MSLPLLSVEILHAITRYMSPACVHMLSLTCVCMRNNITSNSNIAKLLSHFVYAESQAFSAVDTWRKTRKNDPINIKINHKYDYIKMTITLTFNANVPKNYDEPYSSSPCAIVTYSILDDRISIEISEDGDSSMPAILPIKFKPLGLTITPEWMKQTMKNTNYIRNIARESAQRIRALYMEI